MASSETELNWLDYLSSAGIRENVLKYQQELMEDRKNYLKSKHIERKLYIENQLQYCSDDIKAKYSSHINQRGLHIMVYKWLNEIEFHKDEFQMHIPNTKIQHFFNNNSNLEEYFQDFEANSDNSVLNLKNETNGPLFRSWKEMPVEKLNDRLSKGEILTRDEWIPGVSESKRNLRPDEAQEHLNFAKKLLHEGREEFKRASYSRSLTLFHQGIQLLNWVGCIEKTIQKHIEDFLIIFLKNHSLSCLKTGEYHQSIKSSSQIIEKFDKHDGKALWLRAQAYSSLGKLRDAKIDYVDIIKSPYTLKAQKIAARQGLFEIANISKKNNSDMKLIFQTAVKKDFFSFQRSPEVRNKNNVTPADKNMPNGDRTESSIIEKRKLIYTPLKEDGCLNQDKTKKLLEDLLNSYTDNSNKETLEKLWKEADYEERRIIIKLKNVLPAIQSPIFKRHGLMDQDHHKALKTLNASVNYWKKFDTDIKSLQQDCWKAIFGEAIDY